MASDVEGLIGGKVIRRLVLPCALFILMGSIDRANVGFAALQMNAALGLSASQYGAAAGIIFVGYVFAKYPSVLLYERIGMRRWLSLITLTWGVAASAMAIIQSPTHLYALRIIIGFAEGGLASGLVLYLSHWASDRYRATILALPIMANPIAQIIGAPISGWLLEAENPLSLDGWRWMFLIEGLPAVVLGLFALFYFPDNPSQAKWLSDVERRWLTENVKGARKPEPGSGSSDRWSALRNPVGWLLALIWFGILAGNYGIMFWLPQIVSGLAKLSPMHTGLIVALPWAGSAFGLYFNARHSDRTQERYLHIALPALLGGAGLLAAYLLGPGLYGLAALIIGGTSIGCTIAAFWAIPSRLLSPEALPMGVVAINIIGSFAGLIVPTAMGYLADRSGSFFPPIMLIVLSQLGLAAVCLTARKLDTRTGCTVVSG